jgi:hypothetical protein
MMPAAPLVGAVTTRPPEAFSLVDGQGEQADPVRHVQRHERLRHRISWPSPASRARRHGALTRHPMPKVAHLSTRARKIGPKVLCDL